MLYEDRNIQVGQTRLRVLVADNASETWLIFFPGLGGTAEQFLPFLCESKLHRVNVVAVDPPGHGCSAEWFGEFNESSVSRIWRTIIDDFGIQNAVIGGHSYGAYCALMGDTILLEQVKGIVLFDGGYLGPFEQTVGDIIQENRVYIENYSFPSWSVYLEERRLEVSDWSEQMEVIARAAMNEAEDGRIRLRVSLNASVQASILTNGFNPDTVVHTDKPALLLRATLPGEVNNQRAEGVLRLLQRLVNLKVTAVQNSGHDVITEHPSIVSNEVWSFLRKFGLIRM